MPVLAFGQEVVVDDSANPDVIYIETSPKLPSPGTNVSIEVKSVPLNMDSSMITWSLNGIVSKTGIGAKKIVAVAPSNGDTLNISVSVLTSDGQQYDRSVAINPASVDLLWEAYSYTPPFYKGKGLVSHESLVKVVAAPDFLGGISNNTNNFIFTWKKDGTVLGSLSGRGKNIQIFRMPKLTRSMKVEVEVVDLSGNHKAKGSLILSSRDPLVLVYEKDPLFGVVFNKSLGGENELSKNEITLVGYPYFFADDNIVSSKLRYSWKINRGMATSKTNEIVLRAPEKVSGTSNIYMTVENVKEIMQSASAKVGIIFGEGSGDSNPFF